MAAWDRSRDVVGPRIMGRLSGVARGLRGCAFGADTFENNIQATDGETVLVGRGQRQRRATFRHDVAQRSALCTDEVMVGEVHVRVVALRPDSCADSMISCIATSSFKCCTPWRG